MITDWCDDYLACRLCDAYLRLTSPAHFRMYGRDDCAGLLAKAGFPGATVDRYKISWMWGLMTAQASRGA